MTMSRKTVKLDVSIAKNIVSFLLVVPEKDLIKLEMNIEQGMKLVISGGIITPDFKKKIKKKLSSRK